MISFGWFLYDFYTWWQEKSFVMTGNCDWLRDKKSRTITQSTKTLTHNDGYLKRHFEYFFILVFKNLQHCIIKIVRVGMYTWDVSQNMVWMICLTLLGKEWKEHYERKYCIFNGETLTVLINCYILYFIYYIIYIELWQAISILSLFIWLLAGICPHNNNNKI